jgi:hypothetical protein
MLGDSPEVGAAGDCETKSIPELKVISGSISDDGSGADVPREADGHLVAILPDVHFFGSP